MNLLLNYFYIEKRCFIIRKIILLSLSILIFALIGCAQEQIPHESQQVELPVEDTEEKIPEEEIKEPIVEKPSCSDECDSDSCDGYKFISCEAKEGCKSKIDQGFTKGKCNVACTSNSDCKDNEQCSEDFKCIEEVYKFKEGYKTYNIKDYNVGMEVKPRWKILGIVDADYYPGITLYEGWYENWRNQLRLGLFHDAGQSVDLQDFDDTTQFFEDYQRQWCKATQENPVWEVSPAEEGWTTCLEMGDFTFKEITIDGRKAYHVTYGWKDEFRLPDGEPTKDVYSGWTIWTNLIPYGDDLILASGYTINENVDEQKDIILYSINSVKILNDGQPIFEN